MDLTALLPWLRFAHVLGAFVFAAGHGVSIVVAFQLRRERDPARLRAMLDLSGVSLNLALLSLLVVLVTGIAAGLVGGSFGRGWIWLSLVVLLLVGGLMTPLGANHFRRIREAVGDGTAAVESPGEAEPGAWPVAADPADPPPVELEALLAGRRPELLALVGGGGFAVILWLMMFKPF
ncbi:MAG TPA: DUF2269 family protein [Candidatus Binatia bacterium]|nr:DUF2269 family protein [Candidatus Binatia bacterium]